MKLKLSTEVLRKLLDFTKGELINISQLATLFGVRRDTIANWSNAGKFPRIVQYGNLGWRFVSRQEVADWLKTFSIETEQHTTREQRYFSTREVADDLGLNVNSVIGLLRRGIVRPLEGSRPAIYTKESIETLRTFLHEQEQKETERKKEQDDFAKMKNDAWVKVDQQIQERVATAEKMKKEQAERRQKTVDENLAALKKSMGY